VVYFAVVCLAECFDFVKVDILSKRGLSTSNNRNILFNAVVFTAIKDELTHDLQEKEWPEDLDDHLFPEWKLSQCWKAI
jgi:hypothetical protein